MTEGIKKVGWQLGRPRVNFTPPQKDKRTGCVLWKGSVDCYGHAITFQKGKVVRIRQIEFETAYGRKPRRLLPNSCGKSNCIAVAHLVEADKNKAEARREATIAIKLNELAETIERLELSCEMLKDDVTAQEAFKLFEAKLLLAREEKGRLLTLQKALNAESGETNEPPLTGGEDTTDETDASVQGTQSTGANSSCEEAKGAEGQNEGSD